MPTPAKTNDASGQTIYAFERVQGKGDGLDFGPPKEIRLDERWVSVGEAARILGLSRDYTRRLCDEGKFVEAKEWRRTPRGHFRIRLAAVHAMREKRLNKQMAETRAKRAKRESHLP